MPFLDPDPLTDALRELFRGKPADPSLPRGVRWVKFFLIIFVGAAVLGSLFAISIYVVALLGFLSPRTLHGSLQDAARDTMRAFWHRFILGACLGGSFGLVYIVRCLIKKIDP